MMKPIVYIVIGPTASGKTARALMLAREHSGEVISVDSRQVYRTLDIGTEKITPKEMQGIPHHLIDIRNPEEVYSAHDFVSDATRIIQEIQDRGNTPILAGGTHFYIDALLYGIPDNPPRNDELRAKLEKKSVEDLYQELSEKDPIRASTIEKKNKRRLVRALEILDTNSRIEERAQHSEFLSRYDVRFEVLDPDREELREKLSQRLQKTLDKSLVDETKRVRKYLSMIYHRAGVYEEEAQEKADQRMREFGLEYAVCLDYLDGKLTEEKLFTTLHAKLWQLAKRQKNWIKKLSKNMHP